MYLKSLTLKGFKSFASPTTLRFEPGITAVVGPNGSGKSNVVDALAWVMGEQGAKTLRGGKMEDVIFAGTSSRAPLGRAEVTVTIDNSDNALPIEYSEVSITRRMFRDGASEYEINGSSCRLMDVQELLSDSGIGREMHVIVGQGKLDEILQSRPEDRRAFIEEAAGVLKHRKRKEKALRKLDSMSANLARLTRSDHRAAAPAQTAGPPGRSGPSRPDHPGRSARRPVAAGRRRPGQPAGGAGRDLRGRDHHAPRARRGRRPAGGGIRGAGGARGSSGRAVCERAESVQHTWFAAVRPGRTGGRHRPHRQRTRPASGRRADADQRHRPRRAGCRGRAGGAAEQQLLAELAEARTRLDAARAELAERERRPPRPSGPTWRRFGPRRTGARAWRGWPVRWRPCGRASNRSTTASRGCPSASRRPPRALSRPGPSSKPCRAGSANWIRARSASTSTTSGRWPRCGWPTNASPNCSPPSAAPNARWRRCGPASTRCRCGLERKDGAAWLAENHSGAGLFGPVAKLVKVRPGYEAALAAVLGSAADALAADSLGAARSAVAALKQADGGPCGAGAGRLARPGRTRRRRSRCPAARVGRST